MIAFDIKYKKSTSAEPRIYKNVIICGSFGSEEEGANIGYQAMMPEMEGTEPMPRRFKYDNIEWMMLSK